MGTGIDVQEMIRQANERGGSVRYVTDDELLKRRGGVVVGGSGQRIVVPVEKEDEKEKGEKKGEGEKKWKWKDVTARRRKMSRGAPVRHHGP